MPLKILRQQNPATIPSPKEEVGPEETSVDPVSEKDSRVTPTESARPSPPLPKPQLSEPLAVTLPQNKLLPEKKHPPAATLAIRRMPPEEGINRRAAIERLQELFLLEEELDGPRVTEEILKLPKILGALVLRGQASQATLEASREERSAGALQALDCGDHSTISHHRDLSQMGGERSSSQSPISANTP